MEPVNIEFNKASTENSKLSEEFDQLRILFEEIEKFDLSEKIRTQINLKIKKLNTISKSNDKRDILLEVKHNKRWIIKYIHKEIGLVPKNYFSRFWMIIGMSLFGIPIGLALSLATDNFGLIGAGLLVGMVIGLAYGKRLDEKAKNANKQLDPRIKY